MKQNLFSLQGYMRAALLTNGVIGPMFWLGNVPDATLSLDTSTADKTDSFTGKRLQIGRLPTGTTAKLDVTLDYWSSKNLALAFQASQASIVAGTVTGEVFPAALIAGELVRLDHPFASSVVVTDSTGSPITVDPSDYALEGHSLSTVRIIDPAGYVQPFKGAYSYEAASNLVLFSAPSQYLYVQFDGINTETDEPVLIELWRQRFDPIKSMGLIQKEYGSLGMTAAVLYDTTRAADPTLGGFGRMLQKATDV
jgi:hypothetical protein